jgi:hypothetical protein
MTDHDKRIDLKHKAVLWQQACRLISPLCTPTEFTVYAQIFDRSIGWGRDHCFTTVLNIAYGNGKDWNGCGLSDRTVKRAVISLEKKGVITREAHRNRGTMFGIILIWKEEQGMLSIPKRLKDGAPQGDNVSLIKAPKRDKLAQGIETEYHSLTTFDHGKTEYSPEPNEPEEVLREEPVREEEVKPLAATKTIQELVERTNERTAKKRSQNIERQKQKGNPMAFETIWRYAVETHFPESITAPAWTKVQHGIIMQIAKKWTQGGKLQDFSEFFEWCVVSWPAVMRQQFKWMTKQRPPAAPDFRFWAKFHEEFLNCYHSGKLSKWMRAADRTRLEFLKARGKTHEEALYMIAKEQATVAIKEDTDKKLRAVQITERRIIEREALAKKQRDLGHQPVHPKSAAGIAATGMQPVAPPAALPDEVSMDELEALAANLPEWSDDNAE